MEINRSTSKSIKVVSACVRIIRHLFLVGAFYQNEPDYYSGKFFFVRPQDVYVVDTFSTELLNYWTGKRKRIQVSAKGPPFRVLNF